MCCHLQFYFSFWTKANFHDHKRIVSFCVSRHRYVLTPYRKARLQGKNILWRTIQTFHKEHYISNKSKIFCNLKWHYLWKNKSHTQLDGARFEHRPSAGSLYLHEVHFCRTWPWKQSRGVDQRFYSETFHYLWNGEINDISFTRTYSSCRELGICKENVTNKIPLALCRWDERDTLRWLPTCTLPPDQDLPEMLQSDVGRVSKFPSSKHIHNSGLSQSGRQNGWRFR